MSWFRTLTLLGVAAVAACGGAPEPTDDTDTGGSGVPSDTAPEDTEPVDTDTDTDTGFLPDTDETGVDSDTDVGCWPGWEEDCNGVCFASSLIGNAFCDDGPAPQADFDCAEFAFDGGDCEADTDPGGPCPFPGEVPDCNGACFAGILVGDDSCDDGSTTPADFDCADFGFDGGDCAPDTDVDTDVGTGPCPGTDDVRDCVGRCWYLGWLGDGRCDDGAVQPWGNPDFDCERLAFDDGDCLVDTDLPPDTDPPVDTSLPADTDVPVDSGVSLPR